MKTVKVEVDVSYEDGSDLDEILEAARDTLNQKHVPNEQMTDVGSPYFGDFVKVD